MRNNPLSYRKRIYRSNIIKNNLKVFNVTIRETDLFISSDTILETVACYAVRKYRAQLEAYISKHPIFLKSLAPLDCDPFAPPIIRYMMAASVKAGVGPMATVAGAIAEYVGKELREHSRNVIVENGGDIYLDLRRDMHVGVFAGQSKFCEKVSLHIKQEEMPLGICTSSGTIGHSLSFGKADAVCVKAKSSALADAAATAICNRVKKASDMTEALERGMSIQDVLGVVIILNDHLGAIGDMQLEEY